MAKLGREPKKRRGRAPKVSVVQEVTDALKAGHGFVLARNKGLNWSQATELRKKMREGKVVVKVAKNTLLRLALTNAGIDPAPLKALLKQETMIIIGQEDPVTPAKLLTEFLKGNEEKIEIKGGLLEGKVIDVAGVQALAKLPGRNEMIAQILGSLQAPAQNLVYALNATVAQIVYAVDARRRQLEEGNAA